LSRSYLSLSRHEAASELVGLGQIGGRTGSATGHRATILGRPERVEVNGLAWFNGFLYLHLA